eukprot:982156-Amphidinium_carterae.1
MCLRTTDGDVSEAGKVSARNVSFNIPKVEILKASSNAPSPISGSGSLPVSFATHLGPHMTPKTSLRKVCELALLACTTP